MAPSLQQFIEKSLSEISSGLGDKFYVDKSIEFEVSVTTSVEAGGKISIIIAGIGGSGNREVIQRIKFSIGSKDSVNYKKSIALSKLIEKSPSIAMALERGLPERK